ncbi:MAG: acyl-CoA carboxylase subunit beta [Candidatus Caldarchaeales archaeon]
MGEKAHRTIEELINELNDMRRKALIGGGLEAIEKQHQAGKLTARERINILLDKDSFIELDAFMMHRATEFGMDKRKVLGDGIVTGLGRIDGRLVAVFAQDATFMGGSIGEVHANKISRTLDRAMELGIPIIALNDSGGARIQEGVTSLHAIGEYFARNVRASGVIPQITVMMGPCAGGAVYSPALGDFIIMVEKTSYMFITGPRVVKAVMGEDVSFEELGGPYVHAQTSGVADFIVPNDVEALNLVRRLISYLPSNSLEEPPIIDVGDPADRINEELNYIVPSDPKKSYDVKELINLVFDKDSFLEVKRDFAPNVVVGFARLAGISVGVVANQPASLAGVLDIDSSDKIARFVRFCDCFNIPLITFVDVPGYLPGTRQEHGGIIRHGAKVIYAYVEATVPKISVIVRKAYGGAYIAMCSKSLGADMVFAYPTAEIAVMGPEGAVEIIYRKEIDSAKPEEREDIISRLIREYRLKFANPYIAASYGYINMVIEPKETRPMLAKALKMLMNGKRTLVSRLPKKHGNMPL